MSELAPDLHKLVDMFLSRGGLWIYLFVSFSMIVEYLFPPYPGDVAIFAGGYVSAFGHASLTMVLVMAFLGSIVGIVLVYHIGQRYGRRLIMNRKIFFIREGLLQKTESWYKKVGVKLLLFSKFLPGLRFFLVFFAGIGNVSFKKTLIYTAISCLVWNSLIIMLAYYLQRNTDAIYKILTTYTNVVFLLLLFVAIFFLIKMLMARRHQS